MGDRQPYWCFKCQRERSACGGDNGSCPAVEASAAQYRTDLAAGVYLPLFNTRRLASERDSGISQRDMIEATVSAAKRDGREIDTVRGYGEIRNAKEH